LLRGNKSAYRCESTKSESIAVIYNKKTNMLLIIFLATKMLDK